jgi:hypothetical protein
MSDKPSSRPFSIGQGVLVAVLIAFLLAVVWATMAWTSAEEVEMSIHGWIALALGTIFSLLIGCGLMILMFYSSRSGHDETAMEDRISSAAIPVIECQATAAQRLRLAMADPDPRAVFLASADRWAALADHIQGLDCRRHPAARRGIGRTSAACFRRHSVARADRIFPARRRTPSRLGRRREWLPAFAKTDRTRATAVA